METWRRSSVAHCARPCDSILKCPMDSDFARAWCELVAHICHVSAVAPAALSERRRAQAVFAYLDGNHAECGASQPDGFDR